jgi:predicted nuclease of predicted toxin-antitoxin system
MTKLLIDECISADLALPARELGHYEATHVVWIGKAGCKDWELKDVLLEQGWVLITKNSVAFRVRPTRPAPRANRQT